MMIRYNETGKRSKRDFIFKLCPIFYLKYVLRVGRQWKYARYICMLADDRKVVELTSMIPGRKTKVNWFLAEIPLVKMWPFV